MGLERYVGIVVLFREARKTGPLESLFIGGTTEEFRSPEVRDMSVRPSDSPLEIGRARTCLEHIGVVEALEKNHVERCHDRSEVLEYVSKIGQHTEPLLPCFDHKDGSVYSVMGRRDGMNKHIAKSCAVATRKLLLGITQTIIVVDLFTVVQHQLPIFQLEAR